MNAVGSYFARFHAGTEHKSINIIITNRSNHRGNSIERIFSNDFFVPNVYRRKSQHLRQIMIVK